MKTDINNLNIEEGTVSFWIDPNQVNFDDENVVPLVNLNPPNGSIFIVKDKDKKIKFFHVFLNRGRTDAETDVSFLDNNIKHMFTFIWSVKDQIIKIYIDGKLYQRTIMNYRTVNQTVSSVEKSKA